MIIEDGNGQDGVNLYPTQLGVVQQQPAEVEGAYTDFEARPVVNQMANTHHGNYATTM
jgi:hypothetical protein